MEYQTKFLKGKLEFNAVHLNFIWNFFVQINKMHYAWPQFKSLIEFYVICPTNPGWVGF